MKIKISKSQWERIGTVAKWNPVKKAPKVSNCCGAEDRLMSIDGPSYSEISLCPKCKEHCTFVSSKE